MTSVNLVEICEPCCVSLWGVMSCETAHLHADDGVDEEEHGDQQTYVGQRLERKRTNKSTIYLKIPSTPNFLIVQWFCGVCV